MKSKIAIFGPYPPPLGGISVHIRRMEKFLKDESIGYKIFNHGNESNQNVVATNKSILWYFKFFFEKKFKIFHFHQFFLFHFLYYFLFSRLNHKSKIIVTIHSERILNYNILIKRSILFFLSYTKNLFLISVSEKLNSYLNENGVNSIFLPAYVPPSNILKKDILFTNKNKIVFLFSVWKINKHIGEKIYNVPLIFNFLKNRKHSFQMLLMIGSKSNSDLTYLYQMIDKYNIEDSVEIVFNENLVDYLHNCKFMVRPNLTDGYGVSIQESLDIGVPAIASDVCFRPKGTILFKNNNLDDLDEKVDYVLKTPKDKILLKAENLNFHIRLIDIYKNILKNETSNTKF